MPDPRAPEGPDQLMAAEPISVLRVRIGILLFLLWWLPVYVLAPAIADLIGSEQRCPPRAHGGHLAGLHPDGHRPDRSYLAGTQLFRTLGRVRRRRVLAAAWHIVWTGDTRIDDADLKPPKAGAPTVETGAGSAEPDPAAHPTGTSR